MTVWYVSFTKPIEGSSLSSEFLEVNLDSGDVRYF